MTLALFHSEPMIPIAFFQSCKCYNFFPDGATISPNPVSEYVPSHDHFLMDSKGGAYILEGRRSSYFAMCGPEERKPSAERK